MTPGSGGRTWAWLVLLACSSAAATTNDEPIIDDPAYTHAQRLVEVEPGRKLNLYCTGEGSPTVVFDAGLGGDTSAWAFVQPAISARTRSCSYDRAGLGFSDPELRPGTSANIVDDLHRLLAAAAIKPPYVLVGHSYGGMNMRLYADLHLDEIAGLVLVDPTEEDWVDSAWKLDPRQLTFARFHAELESDWQAERECVAAASAGAFVEHSELYKRCIGEPDPRYGPAINASWVRLAKTVPQQRANLSENESVHDTSSDQVRAARRWYGSIPLIVLASTPSTKLRPNEPPGHRQALNRAHAYLEDQMAAQSTRGAVRIVPDSDHSIQASQPRAVVDAILEVLQAAAAAKP